MRKISTNVTTNNAKHTTTLDKAEIGRTYAIVSCTLPEVLKIRLAEMGLTPKTTVTVQKRAPLGDPIEIHVRGYSLCIRAETAKFFTVCAIKHPAETKPL